MDLVLVNTSNDISDITSDNLHLISLRLNIRQDGVSPLSVPVSDWLEYTHSCVIYDQRFR